MGSDCISSDHCLSFYFFNKTESAVFKHWMLYIQRISFQIIYSVKHTQNCTQKHVFEHTLHRKANR